MQSLLSLEGFLIGLFLWKVRKLSFAQVGLCFGLLFLRLILDFILWRYG